MDLLGLRHSLGGDLRFTNSDLELLHDSSFLLRKRLIGSKIEKTLTAVYDENQDLFQAVSTLIEKWSQNPKTPKISKGENYRGLPYWVLDYPRDFGKNSTFAIRTMVWWGNEISCTMQLQGDALTYFQPKLKKNLNDLKQSSFHISVNNSPWEYHFEPDNYRPIRDLTTEELVKLLSRDFVKISSRIDLRELENLPSTIAKNINDFIHFLKN